MEFELFDLHEPVNDSDNRKLLRVYSVIPLSSTEIKTPQDNQAVAVTAFLKQTNTRLKKEYSPSWKEEWMQTIDYPFSKNSSKDWFIGRASVPLIALERLKLFGLESEVDQIMKSINYVSSTTGDITLVPKKPSSDLLYLCGIILGDGSLPIIRKSKSNNLAYKITIHSGDKENLLACREMFITLFDKNPSIYFQTNKRGSCWTLEVKGKTIYRFFKNIMKIPHGNKGATGHIPQKIKSLSPNLKCAFLAGMVDSDIGKHAAGMGATFKSKRLVLDLIEQLEQLGITAKNYGTHYKDKKYAQHDFTIPKGQIRKFKDILEENYLPKRKDRLKTLYSLAGVP